MPRSYEDFEDDEFYDEYEDYGEDGKRYAPAKPAPKPAAKPPAPPKKPAQPKQPAAKQTPAPAKQSPASPRVKDASAKAVSDENAPLPASTAPRGANAQLAPSKPTIHLIVVGHVDAGKSTLVGHWLHKLGEVSDSTLRKHQRDAANAGKGSFAYAWAMDEDAEERKRGVTMDVAGQHFETESRHVVLLDAPGHRDFIPKLIGGAVMADVACLVVDATPGEFESGFDGGTTQEHVVLVRSLGVQEIVTCVNKMDNVGWDKGRFDSIVAKLQPFLDQTGFKKVSFIPCSGLLGTNLSERSELCPWYAGKTLLETIDSSTIPASSAGSPMRIIVHNFGKGGPSGFTLHGILASGRIQIGDRVLMLPGGDTGTCKGIELHGEAVPAAQARQPVSVSLQGSFDLNNLGAIDALCPVDAPIPITKHFDAQIVTFDMKMPLIPGSKLVLHCLSASCEVMLRKIRQLQNPRTGEVEQLNPRRLPSKASAVVELATERDVCLEEFRASKDLGRITLRAAGETVAAGIVLSTSVKNTSTP
ncbi:P-loop containing nucleoside triphosphate hydrolase protein [Hyaloraphidium curvatum]|nr:P-loop containing nucleoside triphosphate hydrolase protein [Hyaloraphidium curvatum]